MTPFMREIYKTFLSLKPRDEGAREAISYCEQALCFEVSGIVELAIETVKTLNVSDLRHDASGAPMVGHGGLLVMPHDKVWLEWIDPVAVGHRRRIGALLTTKVDEPDVVNVEITSQTQLDRQNLTGRPMIVRKGQIVLHPDEYYHVQSFLGDHDYDATLTNEAGMLAVFVSAVLLVLNAPYGIKHDTPPVHKRHAREARDNGFELKPHRIIYLDKTRPPPPPKGTDPDYAGPAFHKAFHFVRTHLRHFRGGGHTTVKAHWRGDPRLGICPMHDYKVRP